jgi:hypothetical protein
VYTHTHTHTHMIYLCVFEGLHVVWRYACALTLANLTSLLLLCVFA